MKSTYVAPWIFAALVFSWALAAAQTAPTAPRAAAAPMAPAQTPHTETRTEALPSQPVDKAVDPETPTAGHDDATGKNLIAPDSTQVAKATAKHPDFMTLDTNNHGYLSADDVKHNSWVSSNFARCDADHDGHLSPQEYANCK